MKTLLITLSLLLVGANFTEAFADDDIILQIIDPGEYGHGGIKTPPVPLVISQDGNILTLPVTTVNYTLELRDENGTIVYTAYLPIGTTQIVLPISLSGDFEIRLVADTYYYIGYINL